MLLFLKRKFSEIIFCSIAVPPDHFNPLNPYWIHFPSINVTCLPLLLILQFPWAKFSTSSAEAKQKWMNIWAPHKNHKERRKLILVYGLNTRLHKLSPVYCNIYFIDENEVGFPFLFFYDWCEYFLFFTINIQKCSFAFRCY